MDRFTYKITIEYNGAKYHGWQIQPGEITIQEVVEKGLTVFCKEPIRAMCAGRTDAGVHAEGQVVSFHTAAQFDLETFLRAVNALTPRDIAVLDIERAPDRFDARRWAVSRSYRYTILNRTAPTALKRGTVTHVPRTLDIDAMIEAAACLVGQHDFTSFRASNCGAKTPVRTVTRSELVRCDDGYLEFYITANGFLKHMVRAIIGTLLEIGKGRRKASEMATILEACDRTAAGPTAFAHGLSLIGVEYKRDDAGVLVFPWDN